MSVNIIRIRRIEFSNFKAFRKYSLSISEVNILVGPNNSGKSTVIGALRTLDAAVRFARSRAPARVFVGEESFIGYRIPDESVPISLENVQTDYNGNVSSVTFNLSNGNRLGLVFPVDGGCVLVPYSKNGIVTSAAFFKREFPVNMAVIPVLGPIEHNEQRRERSTVVAALSSHRASRHFRSYWHYNPDGFKTFADLVARTWPSMQIWPPEYDQITGNLSMFCLEGRMTREIYWVGFGFQIWCQLLTHLCRAKEDALVIVDEPEIYLHPDVQRQLLGIIRDTGADVLTCTHSSEMIAEAEPSEIVMIDKRRQSADRLKDISGVQRALDNMGSNQNITLTALAKSRRVLFVEGIHDFRLIRRFARKRGMHELSSGRGITILESGGFGSWEKITVLASGISEALGVPLMIGAIYDRDYFCNEQIENVLSCLSKNLRMSFVLERKEIENYLLVPCVLNRAIARELASQRPERFCESEAVDCDGLIDDITKPLKNDVLSQLMARRLDYLGHTGEDKSQIYSEVLAKFEKRWNDLQTRIALVPGKEVLSILRNRVQETYGVTLTDTRIAEAMNRNDVPTDMCNLLSALETFRLTDE